MGMIINRKGRLTRQKCWEAGSGPDVEQAENSVTFWRSRGGYAAQEGTTWFLTGDDNFLGLGLWGRWGGQRERVAQGYEQVLLRALVQLEMGARVGQSSQAGKWGPVSSIHSNRRPKKAAAAPGAWDAVDSHSERTKKKSPPRPHWNKGPPLAGAQHSSQRQARCHQRGRGSLGRRKCSLTNQSNQKDSGGFCPQHTAVPSAQWWVMGGGWWCGVGTFGWPGGVAPCRQGVDRAMTHMAGRRVPTEETRQEPTLRPRSTLQNAEPGPER